MIHGTSVTAASTVETSISQVMPRSAARPRSGSSASSWASWVRRRSGATVRSLRTAVEPMASRCAASAATEDCWYTSPTVSSGCCSRSRLTTCAAVREPPPRSKKSSPTEVTSAPSTSAQISAIQAAVPESSALRSEEPGSGQGSASRSILPEVRVGRSSTTARRGTSAAGIRRRSSPRAISAS